MALEGPTSAYVHWYASLLELASLDPMGACGAKQLSGARGLDAGDDTLGGSTENTEPREVARPSDKCNTDRNPASAQATSSQGCRSRRSTVSEGSKAFPLPLHQHRVLSQLMSVGVCGFQTLTVPESQPYLAETVHPSLLGRFYRPKNVTFESSIKLNVTEGVSPWILGTPGGGSVGSKESSQPGLSNASKPSSLRVAGTTDAGASPESTRSSAKLTASTVEHLANVKNRADQNPLRFDNIS